MISELTLYNWRNYERAHFAFSARKNVLLGANGSGKSNLLEALTYLGILRSFRTASPRDLLKIGSDALALHGTWLDARGRRTKLGITLNRNGGRQLAVNETAIRSGRDFIQYFQPVVFAPEDIAIIHGAPGFRRRFFDMLGSQLDLSYLNLLHDYTQALRQRSAALKVRKPDPGTLKAYENLLAFSAAELTQKRSILIARFNHELTLLEAEDDTRFHVEYHPQCDAGPEAYLEIFDRNRSREIERRSSLTGCHLDEFHVFRGTLFMRGIASNGQNRLAALCFKLAAAQMIHAQRGAENLVVLADDVTGELDDRHRALFYRTIASASQLFFTFTAMPADPFFEDAKRWQLDEK